MLSLFLLVLDKVMLENSHTNFVKTGAKRETYRTFALL